MRQRHNIPADTGHFISTEIDFKNEKLTTKLRRNKARKPYFKKKHIPKDLEIIQIFFSQVLTDTDSSSIEFIFLSDPASLYPECDVKDILFEFFTETEIRERFDKSDEFWWQFNVLTAQESTF